jgi:hypothetical protein
MASLPSVSGAHLFASAVPWALRWLFCALDVHLSVLRASPARAAPQQCASSALSLLAVRIRGEFFWHCFC